MTTDRHLRNPQVRKHLDDLFVHVSPGPDACEHDWSGWREWGTGGECVCTKCGMGAMAHSIRTGE